MAKVKLTFADVNVTVTVPAGTRLIEVSEKVGAGINYGCRENDCGECVVEVLQGMEHLSEPSHLEQELLRSRHAPANVRLACQSSACGDVTVKPWRP